MKKEKQSLNDRFNVLSRKISQAMGNPWAFVISTLSIIIWLMLGPVFGFSDTWQLWVNTITTVVTFLMVFIIQCSQNREAEAIELKLDEIIKKSSASNRFINLEEMDEKKIENLKKELHDLKKTCAPKKNDPQKKNKKT